MKNLILSLDIGTNNIRGVLINESKPDEIINSLTKESLGVSKSVIKYPEETMNALDKFISEIEASVNSTVNRIICTIGGDNLKCIINRGTAFVSDSSKNEVTKEDVEKAINSARQNVSLTQNEKILHTIPQKFYVDKLKGVQSPVGMIGNRLEAECLFVYTFCPDHKNLEQVLKKTQNQICQINASTLAGANACLTKQEKESGVIAIDLGAGTTGVSVFEDGCLVYTKILPISQNHVRNDIGICFKVSQQVAEMLKRDQSCAYSKNIDKKETISLKEYNGEERRISKKELADVTASRFEDIFDTINKELENIGKIGKLPGGAVLYGGGAQTKGIVELAKYKLNLPVRLAQAQHNNFTTNDLGYIPVLGSLKIYLNNQDFSSEGALGNGGFLKKLSRRFNEIMPL